MTAGIGVAGMLFAVTAGILATVITAAALAGVLLIIMLITRKARK